MKFEYTESEKLVMSEVEVIKQMNKLNSIRLIMATQLFQIEEKLEEYQESLNILKKFDKSINKAWIEKGEEPSNDFLNEKED